MMNRKLTYAVYIQSRNEWSKCFKDFIAAPIAALSLSLFLSSVLLNKYPQVSSMSLSSNSLGCFFCIVYFFRFFLFCFFPLKLLIPVSFSTLTGPSGNFLKTALVFPVSHPGWSAQGTKDLQPKPRKFLLLYFRNKLLL